MVHILHLGFTSLYICFVLFHAVNDGLNLISGDGVKYVNRFHLLCNVVPVDTLAHLSVCFVVHKFVIYTKFVPQRCWKWNFFAIQPSFRLIVAHDDVAQAIFSSFSGISILCFLGCAQKALPINIRKDIVGLKNGEQCNLPVFDTYNGFNHIGAKQKVAFCFALCNVINSFENLATCSHYFEAKIGA